MGHRLHIFRQTKAVIHLQNLLHNFRIAQQLTGENNFVCPMVKANAYGHGDVEVALELERAGAQHLGVGLIEEGLLLRQMGVRCELLVYGIFDLIGAEQIYRWNLTPVLSTWGQIEALEKARRQPEMERFSIHLKFDTGMHRLGFAVSDAERLLQYFEKHPFFEVRGICTHLAQGEDAADLDGESFRQLRLFQKAILTFEKLRPIVHSLNSAGLINFAKIRNESRSFPQNIFSQPGSRPGLLVYGYSPLADADQLGLKPVMSLRSHIVKYHHVKKGEAVSYGGTWKATRDSIVGVLPIGYADGYHRRLSNQAQVLFRGQRVPQVGNVCMDFIMLDLTDKISKSEIDAGLDFEVTLFGQDAGGEILSAHELAAKAQTIPWEILTSVGERVPRVFERENSR